MINRKPLALLVFSMSLLISTLMCDLPDSRESVSALDEQRTSLAEEATRLSREETETAQAAITPSNTPPPTSTSTPAATSTLVVTSTSAATSTLLASGNSDRPYYTFDSVNLPPAKFSVTDPSGDTYVCIDGFSVNDPAVDIISIMIFDPHSLGVTYPNWFVRVELGAPADITFANDWSGSVLVAHAAHGAQTYTITVNEIHAGERTQGTFDESGQDILPDSVNNTFIDDQGNFWFLVPVDTTFMQVASFHIPTEDLPPEQKRCDLAPNEDVYTLDLH